MQVATGLYPMPPKSPLNAIIHGKINRPGFTVEKVYFESVPGFYVTGLLFRPENPEKEKLPAVLNPHGHGGRLQDYGEKGVLNQIVIGAERFRESGRMPKIARCATLARMGCVAFLYDMIGYADNQQLSYNWLIVLPRVVRNLKRLKTGDCTVLRRKCTCSPSLDYRHGIPSAHSTFESLPDVDSKRIAVTGGSGGGTQTSFSVLWMIVPSLLFQTAWYLPRCREVAPAKMQAYYV